MDCVVCELYLNKTFFCLRGECGGGWENHRWAKPEANMWRLTWMCGGVGGAVVRRNRKKKKKKVAGGRGQIRKVRSPSTEAVRFGRSGSSEMNMVLPSPSFPSFYILWLLCDSFFFFFFCSHFIQTTRCHNFNLKNLSGLQGFQFPHLKGSHLNSLLGDTFATSEVVPSWERELTSQQRCPQLCLESQLLSLLLDQAQNS